MPHFFIDTSDEDRFVRDEVGFECVDLEEAKALAVESLPDMAREKLPDGDARTFLAIVRGEDGRSLLRSDLTLRVASLIPNVRR